VAAPPPPPPLAESVPPALALPRSGSRGRVRFTVTCDSPCTGRAKLTVSRAVARRLGLGRRRTLASARVRLAAAGRRTFSIRLSRRVVRRMRRAGARRVATSLRVSVADGQGERTTVRRSVRVRR
jgi:hypothetical protein